MAFIPETWQTKAMRLLWQASGRRAAVDAFLSRRLSSQRALPTLDPGAAIPRFHETEVRIVRSPVGGWSTPLVDVFVLLKAALGFESSRILELGSYRGETARLLAENTSPRTWIRAVDIDPRHGSAYEGQACADKITRSVGVIDPSMFAPGECFDLIFVDAAHDYDSVMHDTKTALGVLSTTGVLLWHDYQTRLYFSPGNHVADALRNFSGQHPIAALASTHLAVHSRHPGWETARLLAAADDKSAVGGDAWRDTDTRG